jgi:NTE family protein
MSMPEPAEDVSRPEVSTGDQRLALCLSGGGFRAALFHLGALRRLNELGILSQVDLIASVSGGSILAAHLATHVRTWPVAGATLDQWQAQIEAPFHQFVRHDIRTVPLLKRFLLPWNWFRPSTQVLALEAAYHKHLTGLMLPDLPERPRFIFLATDLTNGVSWVFERQRVGSYQAGYLVPAPAWPLARAVAASSCFPPVFSPMPMEVPPGETVTSGAGGSLPGWAGMSVSDGGLYDNLGLQPAERYGIVLVSDGGQPFVATVPKGMFGRVKAYLAVSGKQAGAVRKRLLIANFQDQVKRGTYWGIGSAVRRYRPDVPVGYTKEFATEIIAPIRTDMDAFSEAEIAVLVNHGYLLADIAIEVHAPQLVALRQAKQTPYPEWLDQGKAAEALKYSHERRLLGRH